MKNKKVVYVNIYGEPVFAETLAQHDDISLRGVTDATPTHEADTILREAHAYQVSSGKNEVDAQYLVGDALLARMPHLLVASTIGAGFDTVDLDACTRAGVIVVNQSGAGNAEAVAEHVLGMMLCLTKRLIESDRHMRRESGIDRNHYVGRNAQGKTVGVIGFGNIGRRVGALCRAAFEMSVLAYDGFLSADEIAQAGAEKVPLDALLRRADFVIVCCALNEHTRGLVGAEQFALMQPHAYFVTAARGGIHSEQALINALREKRIAGAGVDVWDIEPPPPDHPLLAFDNVIASPHIGGATVESRRDASGGAARQMLDVFAGKRPARLLNPAAWDLYSDRFEQEFGFRPAA